MNYRLSLLLVVAVGIFLAVEVPLFGYTPPLQPELQFLLQPKHDEHAGHNHDEDKKGLKAKKAAKKNLGIDTEIDEEFLLKIKDFEKHLKNKKWGKAIHQLATLSQNPSAYKGMFPEKDGFSVSIQYKLQELLLGLPAEGREAFHLFFDGKAKKLYRTISNSKTLGEKEMEIARRISTHYFFTSVGDNATELLGDAAFEQGTFDSAARYYSMILKNYPDSEISELNLHVKHALALIRARRIEKAQTVIRVIAQQFSGKKIQIGGKPLLAKKYLLDFISADQSQPVVSSIPQNRLLGHSPVPIQKLKIEWQSTKLFSMITKVIGKNNVSVPAITFDSKKAYVNYLGICFAINLQSGKIVWMSQTLKEWRQSERKWRSTNQFQIAIHNNVVIVKNGIGSSAFQRLVAFDSATGKELWNSKKIGQLSQISFLGNVVFDGDRFYVLSSRQQPQQQQRQQYKYKLHCIRTADGKVLWREPMGKVLTRITRSGQQAFSSPSLSRYENSLRMMTNHGTLINFNFLDRKLNWVFKYSHLQKKGKTVEQLKPFNPNGTRFSLKKRMLEEDGIIYMKEKGVTNLIAIESNLGKLLWKRPVGKPSVLVGMDKQNFYLFSNELDAIDRKTLRLKWSTGVLSTSAGRTSIVITPKNLHVFTRRGIYEIDKTNGDIENIYREKKMLLSGGGRLFFVNNHIFSLSSHALTSYTFDQKKKITPNETSPDKKRVIPSQAKP